MVTFIVTQLSGATDFESSNRIDFEARKKTTMNSVTTIIVLNPMKKQIMNYG